MSDRRSKKPLIVPVFIPNQGCPHRCTFCQQEKITSQPNQKIDGKFIRQVLDEAIKAKRFQQCDEREIAFYGGTFTSLPVSRIEELLGAVKPYLKEGLFGVSESLYEAG